MRRRDAVAGVPGAGRGQRRRDPLHVAQARHHHAERGRRLAALLGEAIGAEEAERAFLINRVVPPERLMEEARAVAARICRHPPAAVRVEMEASCRAQDLGRAEAIAFTRHLYRLQRLGLAGGGDALEGGFLYRRDNR